MKNDKWSSAAGEAFESGYLRSELEEFEDESVYILDRSPLSIAECNRRYEELLDWERAPSLPISDWGETHWSPPDASNLSDAEVSAELHMVAERLYYWNHIIQRADHLSDRRLYNLLLNRVLPCQVKRLKCSNEPCCWDFCAFSENWRIPTTDDVEEYIALTYYSSDKERVEWEFEKGCPPPPKRTPKYRRDYFPFNNIRRDCDC